MQQRFASDPLFQATVLLLQERIPRASAFYAHTAELTGIQAGAGSPEIADSRARQPRHADPGGAAAVQRPLPRHGHQRGRRLQPLEGPRRHALARRRHPRPLGHVLLPARRGQRRDLVHRAPADVASARSTTRRSSRKGARSFAAATAISIPIPRSPCRRKTTSSCAGCASPTAPASAGPSRSRATPRWCWRRPPPTRCIRRSAISSCRPRSSSRARPSCARAGPARATSRCRGCST